MRAAADQVAQRRTWPVQPRPHSVRTLFKTTANLIASRDYDIGAATNPNPLSTLKITRSAAGPACRN
jgi:hypothetical protein